MALSMRAARMRRCHRCEHWVSTVPRGKHTSEYCSAPGESRIIWRNLTVDYIDGPERNCPSSYWGGLRGIDVDKLRAEQAAAASAAEVRDAVAMLDATLRTDADAATIETAVDRMVSAHILTPEQGIAVVAGLTETRSAPGSLSADLR